VNAHGQSTPDWRDAAAYAPLHDAERSMFAWEWLRRDPGYRSAARACSTAVERKSLAARFGLIDFEPAHLPVPRARPLWRAEVHPFVLAVRSDPARSRGEEIDLRQFEAFARFEEEAGALHLLLSDGFRSIRIDAPRGTFADGPAYLAYRIGGLASAERQLLTLRRFLALCRTRRFSRALHAPEPRSRRWIMMLRASDALAAGAGQREIAEVLLSRSAGEPRWRSREPSVRSQAQRLVRSTRLMAAGGYRTLLG
jgi:hypothetical protein